MNARDERAAVPEQRQRRQKSDERPRCVVATVLITLFSQPAMVQFLLLAAFGLACLAISLLVLRWLRYAYPEITRATPVPPFIGTIATAWALALGFAAADVWAARAQAEQAASEERSTISRLAGMAAAEALDVPAILEALRSYQTTVVTLEWGELANREPVAEVDSALQHIRIGIVRLANTGTSPALIAKMTQDFDELQDARNKRLAIGSSSISQYKWYLVLFLTFLSMVALAAVHADRPAAARNALGVFMVAAVVSLWILVLHATPYSGSARIAFDSAHVASMR